ncbi:hypothetical protein NAEGRDRAFT_57034 [Naegleria gruberi]|uniref:Uncharacterized protein n=1 Tax=Naegleria gruberi TaxID=5762 RepID=D2V3S9_NAEGR|nr:uncharacterized protein NAEGRDRAFT_57034 [Naegleria gruberi]EFC48407.1 hypothetical protein NAEGRDRAFT_57034 [Naegleria gruberi]|eukprot:XP_002681151.1 hypothetical protein NAEGRDRAFT_57034 [Naegleria gruberi strain NEG-M]
MVLGFFLTNKKQRSDNFTSLPEGGSSYSLMSKTIHRIDDDIVIGQHLGLEDLDLHSENRKSSHSIRYSKSTHDLKPIKLSNPNKWFEVIDLLKDTIFEYVPLMDLSNRVAKSCFQLKSMVTNFVGSRQAQWWAQQWLWTYFSNPHDSIFYTRSLFSYGVPLSSCPSPSPLSNSSSSSSIMTSFSTPAHDRPRIINGRLKRRNKHKRNEPSMVPDRVLIGFVDQHTEGSCKYKSFHAFKVSFEQIIDMYESKLRKNEYKANQAEVRLEKDPILYEVLQSNHTDSTSFVSSATKLFSIKGILGDLIKSLRYSASGRAGVANGEFIKEINRQLSNAFEQEGDYRKTRVQPLPAPIFKHFREQFITFLKALIYGWWPLCYSGQLVIKRAKFVKRVVSKGVDISMPLFSTNIVKIVSIVYESKDKDPITLFSFVYEKEVQN